jgi:putative aminopeptidase FrvX
MTRNSHMFCEIAGRLMRCPAAPYHEDAVRAEVERICSEQDLACKRDDFGNVLVEFRTVSKGRALVLAAHMDHPGFEIIRPLSPQRWRVRFLGGVPDSYFRQGIPVRLMPGGELATLGKRIGREKDFEVHARRKPRLAPRFAVWELTDFEVRKRQIHARACDDLGGVAAILAALIELKRRRARVNVIGVISRAEEVGFQGALTVAASRQLPKDSLVVSLETSRELPPVKMGQGVIIRVGDRTSTFDSAATRFLTEVAADLARRRKSFRFQRALMYGGTCEATAYQEFGFETAALCVALGNYHNCDGRNRIAAEYINIEDATGMVELLAAAASEMRNYGRLVSKLPERLNKLLRDARKKLRHNGTE